MEMNIQILTFHLINSIFVNVKDFRGSCCALPAALKEKTKEYLPTYDKYENTGGYINSYS